MSRRRAHAAVNAQTKEQLSLEMRQSRLSLFIQQFEKEAQERVSELEAKMDNMLATVDKVFKVELMKKPPSLINTLIGDLMNEEGIFSSEVSILAIKKESPEMKQPLRRVLSTKVREGDAAQVSTPGLRSSTRTAKGGRGSKRAKTLVASNSAGNLRGTSATVKRTQSRVAKTSDKNRAKLRSVVSAGDLHCSMAGSCAHITVTTAQGQTVSFSEETKDINLELLDDVAWCQIQRLTRLMDYLSRQNRFQP